MRAALLTAWVLLVVAGIPKAGAVDYHTSPECWSGPRIHQAGAVPEEWRSWLVVDRVPMDGPSEPMVLSDNGAYGFRLAVHPADPKSGTAAFGEILIDNERDYMIRLSTEGTKGLDARWINESWLFVRVWWGRIAGSDVIFDVEGETILHQAQIRWGGIAFEQYKQACGDSCPCNYSGMEQKD